MTSHAAQSETLLRLSDPEPDADSNYGAVVTAERDQLSRLDVPYFEQRIAGTDLLVGDEVVGAGFFASSGLADAVRRVDTLDANHIELQLGLMRNLLSAKFRRAHRAQADRPSSDAPVDRPTAAVRLAAARAAGDLLVNTCIADDAGTVEWLGIDSAPDLDRSCYGPLGSSLYSGRMGIAVFLAALGDRHPGPDGTPYRDAAAAAASDFTNMLKAPGAAAELRAWWNDRPLGLAGSGGELLAALLLRRTVPVVDEALHVGLDALINAADPDRLSADDDTDIVFGCAGLIGPLLMIGTPAADALARTAGMRIAERQHSDGGWVVPSVSDRALTGFSHGASGRAAALAVLAAAMSDDDVLHEAAARALKFERAQFDTSRGNWPDHREPVDGGDPAFMLSWCHGAPGIALGRLCMQGTPLWDAGVEDDLACALAATTALSPIDDSLCCGRFGRASILRLAADRHDAARWLADAEHLESHAFAGLRSESGFTFGDVYGLFQGVSGVGLALLDGLPGEETGLRTVLSAGLDVVNSGAPSIRRIRERSMS
jgi:type 2 lantibiotic biosynthesis protein LanM